MDGTGEIGPVQARIDAFIGNQFIMSTGLNNLALIDHQDPISILNC